MAVSDLNSDLHTLADFSPLGPGSLAERVAGAYAYYRDFRAKGYFQHRRELLGPPDREVDVADGRGGVRRMLMMGSNSYLGLASDPRVIEASRRVACQHGSGSGGAAMLSGTTRMHRELEEELADWLGFEEAVVFPSGFAANLGTLTSLLGRSDVCFSDELVHASLLDGIRMARCRTHRFGHNDLADLARMTRSEGTEACTVVVDGVYSMDGDLADLRGILEVLADRRTFVICDESHALGTLGREGRGAADHHGLLDRVDVLTSSFGKAMAASAGFVATSAPLATYLRLYARTYFFSTAPTPTAVAAALEAVRISRAEPERRDRLQENSRHLRAELRRAGWDVPDHPSAVVVVPIGEELVLRQVSRRIDEEGLYVNPVPFPAVPRGQGRLRLGVMAIHTREDLDRTAEILTKVGREFGLVP